MFMKTVVFIFYLLSRLGYFSNGLYFLYHVYLVGVQEGFLYVLFPLGWIAAFFNMVTSWMFWILLAWTVVFYFAARGAAAIADEKEKEEL